MSLNTSFCLFFLFIHVTALSQVTQITGQVLDEQTSEPLPYAGVFINKTTIGVTTNKEGEFVLTNFPSSSFELVVSYVGYTTFTTIVNPFKMKQGKLLIELAPATKKLDAVEVITTKDKEWEKKLVKFTRVFLGNTPNASLCKITNPEVLSFYEDDNKTFAASAAMPLEIDNNALGYHIKYFLDSLVADPKCFSIRGKIYFEEIKPMDEGQGIAWMKRRRECYRGSQRHLFKAMIQHKVQEEGFKLYVEKNTFRSDIFERELNRSVEVLKLDNMVHNGRLPGQYVIFLKRRMEVHDFNVPHANSVYKDIDCGVSWVVVKNYELEVDSNGVVLNPSMLEVSGAMNEARIADQLAYDYKPANN